MIVINSSSLSKEEVLFFAELKLLTKSEVVCEMYNNSAGPTINRAPELCPELSDDQITDINQSLKVFREQRGLDAAQKFTIKYGK